MRTPSEPRELIDVSQHQSSQVGGHFRATTSHRYERSGSVSGDRALWDGRPLAHVPIASGLEGVTCPLICVGEEERPAVERGFQLNEPAVRWDAS